MGRVFRHIGCCWWLAIAVGAFGGCSGTTSPAAPDRTNSAPFTGAWQGQATIVDCLDGVCNPSRRGTQTPILLRLDQTGDRVVGVLSLTYYTRLNVEGVVTNGALILSSLPSPDPQNPFFSAVLSDCELRVSGGLTGQLRLDIPLGPESDGRWEGGMLRLQLEGLTRAEQIVIGAPPSFTGHWSGLRVWRTCTESAAAQSSCLSLNSPFPFDLTLVQVGDLVTGTWDSIPVSGVVATGMLVLTGSQRREVSGGVVNVTLAGSVTRDAAGRMTGTFNTHSTLLWDTGVLYSDLRVDGELMSVILLAPGQQR